MKRAVFFDRDGVVNELLKENGNLRPPWTIDEIKIIEDFIRIKKKLEEKYLIYIISNQPDYKRGYVKKANLAKINSIIIDKVKPNDFKVDYTDNINYKKPSPYMLNKLIKKYKLDISESWLVGDRWSDIEAGNRSGCKTILLKKYYSFEKNNDSLVINAKPNYTVKSLNEIEAIIL